MTDDRAALGSRIAEAMGWPSSPSGKLYAPPNDDEALWSAEELVSWEGYGIVDAWMREQGWGKNVWHYGVGLTKCTWFKQTEEYFTGTAENESSDEPLAAIQAALKALEARDDTDD